MKKINVRRSFSAKVSLWVLLLAVPIFFGSLGLLFMQSRQVVRDEAVDRAHGVLYASMQRISRHLITTETTTNAYCWKVEDTKNPDSLMALSHRIVELNPYVDGCAISFEPGVIPEYPKQFMAYSVRGRDTIPTAMALEFNYFARRWYQYARDEQKAGWVVYFDERNSLKLDKDGMIAAYSKPLYSADSTFIGVMSIALSLPHLSRIVASEHAYPHSYFFMIDEKGRYVGHPDMSRLFKKTIFSVADPQDHMDQIALGYEMTQGHVGQMSVEINGVPSLVCYQPVTGTSWSLAIVCPDSDILKGYNTLTYILFSLLFVGMFLIVLSGYKAINYALRPLRQLKQKSQAIAEGDLEVDIKHTKREDVVGRLQNSFVTMLESLKQNLDNVHAASRKAQQYNNELEQATELVKEADQQKTLFMKNMTHQVRTPLNILVGFAQILRNQSVDGLADEEIKKIAETMDESSKQLNRLVLMLYDSSDKGMEEAQQCDKNEKVKVNEVARIVINYVMDITPNLHIGFETDVPDTFIIRANEKLVAYSISEVIFNAVKYSDREHIMVRVNLTPSSLRFIIEDTGKGIAEADRERIFKFFTKVDDYSDGLGLGLPLARSHAEVMGGDFYLDADYQKGARFVFELPLR